MYGDCMHRRTLWNHAFIWEVVCKDDAMRSSVVLLERPGDVTMSHRCLTDFTIHYGRSLDVTRLYGRRIDGHTTTLCSVWKSLSRVVKAMSNIASAVTGVNFALFFLFFACFGEPRCGRWVDQDGQLLASLVRESSGNYRNRISDTEGHWW